MRRRQELCMKIVSRRRAITLASSLAAAPLLNSIDSLAQPGAPTTVFDMANFTAASSDHDAAFAKAVAAISEAAAEANKAGRPAHIVLNLDKNAIYRIKRPILLNQLSGIEVHGNGAQLINTARASTLQISDASHITIRDLTIDYDPLPFIQGTIASFDRAAREIIVKVDPGYPDDPALLATITDGFFKVMDRRTRALKPGARDFLSPSRVERVKDRVIKAHLQWGANDRFPSQLPIAVGDVVAITNSSGAAIGMTGSVSTTLIDLKLLASPGMGIMEDAGAGGTRLQKVSIVPGPRPKGATTDRLVSTNSDGSHFATIEHGPTIEDCTFSNTSDDAVNVHGFYYYVIQKAGPGRYLLSPKWDQGLMAGDKIETCEHGTFQSLGQTRITQLTKRKAPELKGKIAPLWKSKSPTTQPDLVYDVVLQHDLPLKTGDGVTSLTRIGAGTAIRRCSFHACGRVLVKSPNSVVEACQFTYANGTALQAGSDIGFWSESGFANNLTLRNNHFTHSITGANEMTWGSDTLGAITVGVSLPEGVNGFPNSFQNRNVTIEGNRIDDSYIYAIFVSNADSIRITGNVIGQTFIRGSAFDAGGRFGLHPDSAILIGRSRNAQISSNTVARGRVTKVAVAVDRTCDMRSVHVENNKLT
jgi:hypothetical protein